MVRVQASNWEPGYSGSEVSIHLSLFCWIQSGFPGVEALSEDLIPRKGSYRQGGATSGWRPLVPGFQYDVMNAWRQRKARLLAETQQTLSQAADWVSGGSKRIQGESRENQKLKSLAYRGFLDPFRSFSCLEAYYMRCYLFLFVLCFQVPVTHSPNWWSSSRASRIQAGATSRKLPGSLLEDAPWKREQTFSRFSLFWKLSLSVSICLAVSK